MSHVQFRHTTFQPQPRKPGEDIRTPRNHVHTTYEVSLDLADTQPETLAATLKMAQLQVQKAAGVGPSQTDIDRATKLVKDSVAFGVDHISAEELATARTTLKEAGVSIF